MRDVTITLTEEQRQATLMALAHLAVERPGWDHMLSEIARKMDNATAEGPELYLAFKKLHQDGSGAIPSSMAGVGSTEEEEVPVDKRWTDDPRDS